jgi:hypothetical protein
MNARRASILSSNVRPTQPSSGVGRDAAAAEGCEEGTYSRSESTAASAAAGAAPEVAAEEAAASPASATTAARSSSSSSSSSNTHNTQQPEETHAWTSGCRLLGRPVPRRQTAPIYIKARDNSTAVAVAVAAAGAIFTIRLLLLLMLLRLVRPDPPRLRTTHAAGAKRKGGPATAPTAQQKERGEEASCRAGGRGVERVRPAPTERGRVPRRNGRGADATANRSLALVRGKKYWYACYVRGALRVS